MRLGRVFTLWVDSANTFLSPSLFDICTLAERRSNKELIIYTMQWCTILWQSSKFLWHWSIGVFVGAHWLVSDIFSLAIGREKPGSGNWTSCLYQTHLCKIWCVADLQSFIWPVVSNPFISSNQQSKADKFFHFLKLFWTKSLGVSFVEGFPNAVNKRVLNQHCW